LPALKLARRWPVIDICFIRAVQLCECLKWVVSKEGQRNSGQLSADLKTSKYLGKISYSFSH
jgi:hypothetical protein